MKKLLAALAALGITASSATTVISCGGGTKTVEDQSSQILDALTGLENNEENVLALDAAEPTTENITKTLLNLSSLKNFKNLSFELVSTNPGKLSADGSSYQDGSVVVKALYNDQQIGGENFTFKFNTLDHLGTNQILDVLNNNLELGLGDGLAISTPLGNTINQIISYIAPIIKPLMPSKIPATFDSTDSNWKDWNTKIGTIETLLGGFSIVIDGQKINIGTDSIVIDKQMTIPNPLTGEEANVSAHLEVKVMDLIKNILPDIVHLFNFIAEQQQANKNENLILLLIQYFLDTPRDINSDGFGAINKTITTTTQDDNGEPIEETLVFNNNLEIFLHDLFEGWQNAAGVMNTEDNGDSALNVTLDLTEVVGVIWHLKYRTQKEDEDNNTQDVGIFTILDEAQIFQTINSFLDYDLANPLTLTLNLLGAIPQDISTSFIASSIKNSLKLFVKSAHPDLTNVDDSTLEWNQGIMKVEYLDKTSQEWVSLASIEDLEIGKAADLRIRFTDNEFTDAEGNTFSLDKDIILNLDISASAFN